MTLQDQARHLERQQFFDGQRLFATDLQGLESFSREMRWLHNKSLHQPGIGNGFAVHGLKGDRKVTVDPGYAIDSEGREIVLLETEELDVPPVAGEPNGDPVFYDLVVSYPDDELLEVAETRAGVCAPRGVVRLREEPVFCWVRLVRTEVSGTASAFAASNGAPAVENLVAVDAKLSAEIESGLRLVIARAEVLNCQLNKDLSIAERRNARTPLGPHIACGDYAPDPWDPFWWCMEEDIRAALTDLFNGYLEESEPVIFAAPRGTSFGARVIRESTLFSRYTLLGGIGPIILPLGLETAVPTASACFMGLPHYMPRLAGKRIVELDLVQILEDQGLLDLDSTDLTEEAKEHIREAFQLCTYWDGLINVLDPARDQFTARLAVMTQLLELPDLDVNLGEIGVIDHMKEQFRSTPLGEKLEECGQLSGAAREQCVAEAVEMALALIEDVFLSFIESLGWSIVWMGVEG